MAGWQLTQASASITAAISGAGARVLETCFCICSGGTSHQGRPLHLSDELEVREEGDRLERLPQPLHPAKH